MHRSTLLAALALAVSGLAQDRPVATDPEWRYTVRRPAKGWQGPRFDDTQWKQAPGGFGTHGTPGARIGTVWNTRDIWLRRTVKWSAVPKRPALLIHHDEGAQVFVNGERVASLRGYKTKYEVVLLEEKHRGVLRADANLLAVHCRQTVGGQFIDVHLIDADHPPRLPQPKPQTKPFATRLTTTWGEKVTAANAWTEYPRPQLVRDGWRNLNGTWDYAITSIDRQAAPAEWKDEILVPFCLESKLSGVQRLLLPSEALWYRRTFAAKPPAGRRTLLHFEAVDYRCKVWVNGQLVGEHVGGNTPFSFDVTEALREGDDNNLIVRVEDKTGGAQLRGKQSQMPRGIWYTRVSGIWQTVWLEDVPARRFADLDIATDPKAGTITVRSVLAGEAMRGEAVEVVVKDGDTKVAQRRGTGALVLRVEDAKLWSPATPHLYDLELRLLDGDGKVVDRVTSYAGIRSVGKRRDADGHLRFTLNGEVVFHWGPLDQGWWPDGLLTPPSDGAMRSDIEFLKAAGFNMIRKHIKVEPRRYYYHCDRLGMMVWQDHVSGGPKPRWTRLRPDPRDAEWSDADHAQFRRELDAMIDALESHPSIVVWVPFNEAWGQHRTLALGRFVAKRDPTRLVNVASGGNFWPVGDIVDQHRYPDPGFPFDPKRFGDYIKVVGEFGGHGWPERGHLFDADRRNWGYGGLPKDRAELAARYQKSLRLLDELRKKGVAAGVYTQTTDVEGEVNGLLTYDRRVTKIPAETLAAWHEVLFAK